MREINKSSVWLALLLCSVSCVSTYKFLGVLHTTARSHYNVGSALMKELARKGHHVTVISPFPLKEPLKNFVDVPLKTVMEAMKADMPNLFVLPKFSKMQHALFLYYVGIKGTLATFNDPNFREFMKLNATFDAVICDVFLSEALFGLSEYFQAPLIGFSAFGAHRWNTDMVGSPSPKSYVPSPFLPYTDHMTLSERVGNLFYELLNVLLYDTYYMRKQMAIYKRYFPSAKRSLLDVRRNAALVLVNSHVSLSYSRPYVANHIEVGGMHINRKLKPLPENIRKFIEESPHGVIYFSMGSILKSATLPLFKIAEILDTFAGLRQRVLWKFENAKLQGKLDNVFISDWFPQNEILAHDNVIAFITHGGMLSTMESIYHGKPFIGIPIFGDQFLNMARAVTNGYGIMLDYNTLSSTTFKDAIHRITSDPTYTRKIRETAARYRDQPMLPLDLATYWVEHVARHKGAKYLHCAGQDLHFIKYHNIDAMLLIFGGFFLALVTIVWFILLIVNYLLLVFV